MRGETANGLSRCRPAREHPHKLAIGVFARWPARSCIRVDQASGIAGDIDPADIEIAALQLRSVNKVTIGAYADYLYAILNTTDPTKNRGGMKGTFKADELGGTFGVFFNIRLGAPVGTKPNSYGIRMQSAGFQ